MRVTQVANSIFPVQQPETARDALMSFQAVQSKIKIKIL